MDAKPLWKTCKKISLYLIMATTATIEPINFIDTLSQNAITLGIAIYLIVIAYYMTKDPEKPIVRTPCFCIQPGCHM